MAVSAVLQMTLAKPCVGCGCDGSERCVANDWPNSVLGVVVVIEGSAVLQMPC